MSAELLLQELARVTESPNALPSLRRFLVDLAVSGRLGGADEWPSAPLGKTIELKYGKGLAPSDRASDGPVAVYGSNGIVAWTHTALAARPAIVVGRKGSAGALRIAEEPSWTTDVGYYIEPPPSFDIRFLFFALQSLRLETLGKGVKPGLSRSDAYPLPLPQPPLADQHQAVVLVDELMALCDELEAAQTKGDAGRERLRTAALRNLVGANQPKESARFFVQHAQRMLTKPEHVANVRKAILDLAVRGRLVPPDPAHLLGRSTTSSSVPFDLPVGWEWAQLADVCTSIADGDHQPPPQVPEGVPFLVIGNVLRVPMELQDCRRVPQDYYAALADIRKPQRGDVLYTLVGATLGRPVEVRESVPFCVQRHVGILRPGPLMSTPFLMVAFRSGFVFQQAHACATGTGQKTVPLTGLRRFAIPVPPLAEQRLIVAKVNELMAVCDELERSLATEQTERTRLLNALLHNVLERAYPASKLELLGTR